MKLLKVDKIVDVQILNEIFSLTNSPLALQYIPSFMDQAKVKMHVREKLRES
jgi:hypothetical protein